jgi:hypothetical protein
MQNFNKALLIALISLSIIMLFPVLYFEPGKLLLTSGLILTIAGIIQLEITGFFKEVTDEYCDEKKYPFGPPSYITREIIDNPDTPIRTYIKNILFFRRHTGVWMLITGCILQIIGVWL